MSILLVNSSTNKNKLQTQNVGIITFSKERIYVYFIVAKNSIFTQKYNKYGNCSL